MKKLYKNIIAIFISLFLVFGVLTTPVNATATYKVPHWLSYIGSLDSGTYLPVVDTYAPTGEVTEAVAQRLYTFDGKIINMFSRTRIANSSGDTTYTLRINGVDTAMTWTVPQNATGEHGYTGEVAFSDGDLLSIGVSTTAGSVSELTGIGFKVQSDDGETRRVIASYNNGGVNFSTFPRRLRPAGEIVNNLTTDAVSSTIIHNDCVLESIAIYAEANTRTADITIVPVVNGVSGSLTATIPASTSGRFSATGGSDAISADDLFNLLMETTGSGTLSLNSVTLVIRSDNPREITLTHGNNVARTTPTTNQFGMMGNKMLTSPTELAYVSSLRSNGVLSRFSVYVSASSATQDLLFQSRVNQTDGNITVTVSTPGWYTDTTNSDTIDDDDIIGFRHARVASGTGNTTLRTNTALFTMEEIVVSSFIPKIMFF